MSGPIVGWVRRHDPEWNALHKAIKVAIVVTAGLAIGTLLIGNSQLSTFASFGGVALLLFADFPGGRAAQFGAFIGISVIGAVLIVLGTLASAFAWLAVLGMAVVAFLVLFAGIFSAAAAGGTRAALLAFILPVTLPGTAADIPARLGGWGIAVVLAVPTALLLWPPRDHDKVRLGASAACAALADQLIALSSTVPATGGISGRSAPPGQLQLIDDHAHDAIAALRLQFRSTIYRPVGLTTGSRTLMQLPDRLEWLRAVIDRVPRGATNRWPSQTVDLVATCAEVVGACAEVLAAGAHRPTPATRQRLTAALTELDRRRVQVATFLAVVAATPAHEQDPDLLLPALAHELAYTTHLAGHTVSVSAAADARPLIDRLIGRQAPDTVDGAFVAAGRLATRHITPKSVWFQNSLRGALGLSAAVLIAEITQVQHGFWIVLAAMSVLRTTALTTGSTALRALSGTVFGFLFGAALILLVGTTPWHLWVLLPVTVVVAAYVPEVVSFAAGQAAFTVMVVILFNIIMPVGWTVGLIRIEDIALGCLAGLISGLLLWPHGAAAQIRRALSDMYRQSAAALDGATGAVAGMPTGQDALDDVIGDARSASTRLDDALRQYLSERGAKTVPVEALTTVANGGNRVRLAAEAIAGLSHPPAGHLAPTQPAPHQPPTNATAGPVPSGSRTETSGDASTLRTAGTALAGTAAATAHWFTQVAGVLEQAEPSTVPPPAVTVQAEHLVLRAFRADQAVLQDQAVATDARSMWRASLYVDDAARLQSRLSDAITEVDRRPAPRAGVRAAATA